MLIERFSTTDAIRAQYGLGVFEMKRLGQFVAIAGPNGAGKTRLLYAVEAGINRTVQNGAQIPIKENSIAHHENLLALHSPDVKPNEDENIRKLKAELVELRGGVTLRQSAARLRVVRFVPKRLDLEDPANFPPRELISRHNSAKGAAITEFSGVCLQYVQHSQNRWWEATHQNSLIEEAEKIAIESEYKRLQELIKSLLGAELGRTADGESTIFGKPIAKAGLSEGQRVLIQFVAALHAQAASLDGAIFLLDEPENHLHPSVAIDVLESLRKRAPDAQFWIATHSVPLLAYVHNVEPMSVWFMQKGVVSHAGRRPEKVLQGLLGGEARIAQLHSFTGLPAQLATTNFAVESLSPPKVLDADEGDDQLRQVSTIVSEYWQLKGKLKILDYGAGKGRLLQGFAEYFPHQSLQEKLSYFAYDEYSDDRLACLTTIGEVFDDAETRYFNSARDFFSRKDDGSIDLVILCNVLHEVPPEDWVNLFKSSSLIHRALADDGYVVIVEDQRIPVGEKAHSKGFIVLDTPQIRTLFDVKESDISSQLFEVVDCRGDGRLKAHVISKELIGRVSSERRNNAIKEVNHEAVQQIKTLRSLPPSYPNGQLHGFWTQQLANTHLYLGQI